MANKSTLPAVCFLIALFTASCSSSPNTMIDESSEADFILAENGVTVVCSNATAGESDDINGITYEAVDDDLLRARRDQGADLSKLCTTPVSDMSNLFQNSASFNRDIGSWDTGNVINMSQMFTGATSFNQDIGDWNTKNVNDMSGMFSGATVFNQDISDWDTGNVTQMAAMFRQANSFDQDLSDWCVEELSAEPDAFDAGADNWGEARPIWGASCGFLLAANEVTILCSDVLPGDIGFVDGVQYEAVDDEMLRTRVEEGTDLTSLCTTPVTDMSRLFVNSTSFNQNIEHWDTQNVTDMSSMFNGVEDFNQDIGSWDTRKVNSMRFMFSNASSFDQNISSWSIDNVLFLNYMFFNARSFNQDLSNWCVESSPVEPPGFDDGAASWTRPKPIWGAACD